MPATRRTMPTGRRHGCGVNRVVPPLTAAALLLSVAMAPANPPARPPANPPAAAPPEAERLGPRQYRVGRMHVDLEAATAACAGEVNMRTGMVEYLAVAPGGKLHESVLKLHTTPAHLQVALILLGLEPRGGLTRQGDTAPPRGSPVRVSVSWQRGGRTVRVPGEELVWDIDQKRPMGAGADPARIWVFSGAPARPAPPPGATFEEGLSLIATYRDPLAPVNNALPGGADDTLYKVNERLVPPVGTPVRVLLQPALPPGGATPGQSGGGTP